MTAETQKSFDLFWRNPLDYWRQLIASAECDIAWDRGLLIKKDIDIQTFSHMHFSSLNRVWRARSVGMYDCVEYTSFSKKGVPHAVYPSFDWQRDKLETLMDYVQNPWGEDADLCNDPDLTVIERPVAGQKHLVAITNLPSTNTLAGKQAISILAEIQKAYPKVDLFIHRTYGFSALFNNGFKSGSLDPRADAANGRIILTNGKPIDTRKHTEPYFRPWLHPLGWKYEEMEVASNRCLFNIQSARYASIHWDNHVRPPTRQPGNFRPDLTSSNATAKVAAVKKKRLTAEAKTATV